MSQHRPEWKASSRPITARNSPWYTHVHTDSHSCVLTVLCAVIQALNIHLAPKFLFITAPLKCASGQAQINGHTLTHRKALQLHPGLCVNIFTQLRRVSQAQYSYTLISLKTMSQQDGLFKSLIPNSTTVCKSCFYNIYEKVDVSVLMLPSSPVR